MAISLSSLNRIDTPKPPRIVLYGPHGIGKNTFLAGCPNPVLIDIEGGHPANAPVTAFPQAKTYQDVIDALAALYSEEHDYQTVGIDSLDWFEPMVWAETIRRNNETPGAKHWNSIEDAGYGKGYLATLDVWREYLDAINALRDDKGMIVVQTAHAEIKRFDSPETEPYDRYQIKLQRLASALVQEHADMVLFANMKVATAKVDVGMKAVTRGIGIGSRTLYTEERPSYLAKNRHGLPPELPLSWAAVEAAMTATMEKVAQAA